MMIIFSITSRLFFILSIQAYPPKAMAVFGECAFDRDLCGYRNQSGKAQSANNLPSKATHLERNKNPNRISISKDSITWKLATATNRPANLQDHTFRAPSKIFSNIQIDLKILIENLFFCYDCVLLRSKVGYVYFDVFNQNQIQYPILRSPEFQPKEDIGRCVSFWFTPFGRFDIIRLSSNSIEISRIYF